MIVARPISAVARRPGATLTEVLMAILVMSIGVVSVITLFPLAILRSVRATQLTNSKILEQNVSQLVRANSDLLTGGMEWQPSKAYASDDIVVPRVLTGRMPSPNRRYRTLADGTSGTGAPTWNTGTVTDGGVTWNELSFPLVIDPLGYHYLDTAGRKRSLGWANTGSPPALPRLNCRGKSSNSLAWAESLFVLPDSWVTAADAIPESMTTPIPSNQKPNPVTIVFPSTVDLSGVDESTARVTVVSALGDRSTIRKNLPNVIATSRPVKIPGSSGPNSVDIFWDRSGEFSRLPGNLDELGKEIGRVRVEYVERRYSYMLTAPVPASDGTVRLGCAVFFRRSFEPDEEYVYRNGGTAVMDAANPTNPAQIVLVAGEPDPLIREGNYCLDTSNALWYRIQSVTPAGPWTAGSTINIQLDRAVNKTCNGLIFPRGLVHVFEITL